jgi:ketosteroid isomerase-like protein
MDGGRVERWLEGYVRAWGSNDPEEIGALFTDDARYWTAPFREPWTARRGIVEGWLDRKDEPGQWEFRHQILAVAEDLAFVRGRTTYANGERYSNLWVIRLTEDGRASEFTEWWMSEEPTPEA